MQIFAFIHIWFNNLKPNITQACDLTIIVVSNLCFDELGMMKRWDGISQFYFNILMASSILSIF